MKGVGGPASDLFCRRKHFRKGERMLLQSEEETGREGMRRKSLRARKVVQLPEGATKRGRALPSVVS